MVKKKFKVKSGLIYILFLFIFLSPIKITTTLIASAQEKDQSELRPSPTRLELSLEDCLLKALRNNLSLKAEMITPQIADKNVTLATEKFVPSINFNYNKQNTKTIYYFYKISY